MQRGHAGVESEWRAFAWLGGSHTTVYFEGFRGAATGPADHEGRSMRRWLSSWLRMECDVCGWTRRGGREEPLTAPPAPPSAQEAAARGGGRSSR